MANETPPVVEPSSVAVPPRRKHCGVGWSSSSMVSPGAPEGTAPPPHARALHCRLLVAGQPSDQTAEAPGCGMEIAMSGHRG